MSLKIRKTYVCDVCKAETEPVEQVLWGTNQVEAITPTNSLNQLTYNGQTTDLCMMCMAPVHHAFMEMLKRHYRENIAEVVTRDSENFANSPKNAA